MLTKAKLVRAALGIAAFTVLCAGTCPPTGGGSSDVLFVVNDDSGITSYSNAKAVDGNITPATSLPAGSTTNIFNPRAIAVTKTNVLLIGRENGGITAHDAALALTTTGNKLADRVVEGASTLLDAPISFAYDGSGSKDNLFVGNIGAADGILRFDNVSAATFDGDVGPTQKFFPPDRAPATGQTTEMTINAMFYDAATGKLYVADTSGLNQNNSRILVFNNAASASGETTPDATLTSLDWGVIEDIFVDADDILYIVDNTDTLRMFTEASGLDGLLIGPVVLKPDASSPQLNGVFVSADGVGFLSDRNNHQIFVFDHINTLSDTQTANRTIVGGNTELSTPRKMFLVQP